MIQPIRALLALALLSAPAASGQEAQTERPPADAPLSDPQAMLEHFDRDGDKMLNLEELRELHTALRAQRTEANATATTPRAPSSREAARQRRANLHARTVEEFDSDGDGTLSGSERRELRQAVEKRRRELLETYDQDTDGRLDPSERRAAAAAGDELPPRLTTPGEPFRQQRRGR